MSRPIYFHRLFAWTIAVLLGGFSISAPSAHAQIFMNIKADAGSWIPFLPDYRAASIVNNGSNTVVLRDLFTDEQIGFGSKIGLDGHIHIPDNNQWLLDFDLNFASVNHIDSNQTHADPGIFTTIWFPALDGNSFAASQNGENVNFALFSEAIFYSEYAGFRRQFDGPVFGFDGLNIGAGFSHMAIEQEHYFRADFATSGFSGEYIEDLDSTYLGGQLKTRATRVIQNRNWIFEFAWGMYWMNGDYSGTSNIFNGVNNQATANENIDALATTIDFNVRTETTLFGKVVRPGIEFKYISDVASINHPQTEVSVDPDPISLTTKSSYFLGLNLEVDLY